MKKGYSPFYATFNDVFFRKQSSIEIAFQHSDWILPNVELRFWQPVFETLNFSASPTSPNGRITFFF